MTHPVEIEAQPDQPFIDMTREFDAPRELVFRAFTEPDLVKRWLGPRKYEMDVERYEVRAGGSYRYVHRDQDGNAYGFNGVFHGDPSFDGITQTFEFEGWPGHVALETVVFEDLGGRRSRVRTHSVYQTVADRDQMVESGMETGVREGFERLDELLAELGTPVH